MYGVNAGANDVQDGRKKVEYLCCAHGIRYPYWRDGLGLLEAHGGRRTRVYGGKTWSGPHEYHEHVFEGGMAQLPSGRLFATVRYQRPVWPSDPDNILELCQGSSPNLGPRTPFKHVFLLESDDEGRTWKDEAYYVYAPGVVGKAGNIGYSQSVLLVDDLILTIAGTTDTGGRLSHAACIGHSDLTAIRWKPLRKE